MSTGFVWHERFAWHDAGRASASPWAEPYPALDRPESKRRLRNLLEVSGLLAELVEIPARPATDGELQRFHGKAYIDRIRFLSEAGGGDAGEAARFGPDGFEVARLAAGGCIAATDAVMRGEVDNAYALVRPCGHHAEPDRGRGFCLFGNVALAAMHARAVHGVERIAIFDWDVHHGNGTELAFYRDRSVLTVSIHQESCYPIDTGSVDDIGAGAGVGFNLNIPLPPGSGHGAYLHAVEHIVRPAIRAFEPELVFVAAGYDAAVSDPLGRMLCYSETYRAMAQTMKELAETVSGGRLVVCHEGGYSPAYVPFCGLAVIEELAGVRTAVTDPQLGWYSKLGGQELQRHQAELLGRLSRRFAALPWRLGNAIREITA